jgi:hypothetical protein
MFGQYSNSCLFLYHYGHGLCPILNCFTLRQTIFRPRIHNEGLQAQLKKLENGRSWGTLAFSALPGDILEFMKRLVMQAESSPKASVRSINVQGCTIDT